MAGDTEIQLARWDFTGLRVGAGPHTLEVGRVALHNLVAQLRSAGGAPRLHALHAPVAELADVKIEGVIGSAPAGAGAAAWSLAPLATAEGELRAEIVDAHLLFDAQVTVPIHRGGIDFNHATVEHVGPDSRMGVSRMGIHVDAPNGRSYLYQFASAPVAGVRYEQRGPLPGPWGSDRGSLQLQPFVESMLRHGPGAATAGLTEQSRLLLGRTAVGGDVQLGDGAFRVHGAQGELAGRATGRNRLRLHAEAVGRGISLAVDSLWVRALAATFGGTPLACDEISGALELRLYAQDAQLRFALAGKRITLTGLHLGG